MGGKARFRLAMLQTPKHKSLGVICPIFSYTHGYSQVYLSSHHGLTLSSTLLPIQLKAASLIKQQGVGQPHLVCVTFAMSGERCINILMI